MNESAAILYYVVCKYKENFDEEYCYDVLLLLWISLLKEYYIIAIATFVDLT